MCGHGDTEREGKVGCAEQTGWARSGCRTKAVTICEERAVAERNVRGSGKDLVVALILALRLLQIGHGDVD